MEKITFKINGVEVEGIILHSYPGSSKKDLTITHHIVYAQNRLVKLRVLKHINVPEPEIYAFVLVEYCTIPELDEISPKENTRKITSNVINNVNSAIHFHTSLECILISKEEYTELHKCKGILKDLEGSIKNLCKSFKL